MKKVLLGFIFIGYAMTASAQMGSILKQLGKQIAELQVYLQALEKGYQIAEDGLHTIRDIKNGEFNLHSVFFSSLASVSSAVANMVEVGEIISLQSSMIRQFSGKLNGYRQSGWLQPGEISYIGQVYSNLVKTGQEEINALTSLLTDADYNMTDGERIKAIQAIDADTKQQYRMVQAFTNQTDVLTVQRQQEGGDIGSVKGMYGLP
jgi:hypothetical protein